MCAIQRVNGQDQKNNVSAFERGMVVGARRTGLCQERQRPDDTVGDVWSIDIQLRAELTQVGP